MTLAITLAVLIIGFCAGILVGLLGIGGGVVLVPAMVHLLHMDQHAAQGTSLFVLLPPIGLGAFLEYRKKGNVDLRAGILCAIGMLFGGYIGGKIAVPMPTIRLTQLFGVFLMFSAVLLWVKASKSAPGEADMSAPKGES
ncbi:MAG TPA: sulfite exporter TauE/SafE family protein [Candidatus Acidoferrum sp.]|nr:sulfite exporter TauE/SafE family protein [Candidatus Acidoferrum sp.]